MKIAHLILAAAMAAASTVPGAALAAPAQAASALPEVAAEVRAVDASAGKLTLRHGPIPNLEMGGMTMVFRVADKALLEGIKPGDKVQFAADRVDGAIVVVRLRPAA